MAAQQPLSLGEGPTDTRAIELILAAQFWVFDDNGDNGDVITEAAQKILNGDWLARRDARVRTAVAEEIAKRLEQLAAPVAPSAAQYRGAMRQAAAVARYHANPPARPAEPSVGAPTPDVGIPATVARCSKCGGPLEPCCMCGKPSMCGEGFCVEHCADDPPEPVEDGQGRRGD